jgi:DNA polymerase-3 subunit gamma/tau
VSLYRTWRPKSFGDLVGQDAVVRTLRAALSDGKLAHAYLFSGPRGSGKTSAAKIFARCLNCMNGPTAAPDNDCDHCRAMLAGTGLDVLEIDAASNRGIDEIRALRDAVKFAPAAMRYKIFIVDEAHMLTREGANAFLKTLEEPPPHAVFILATTAPEQLPATILSRCQRYAFRRIPVATMIERMRAIADVERIVIDEAALGAIAYRADGGLRDALTMLEQAASFAGGPIDARIVEDAFGASGRNFASVMVSGVLAGDAARALRAIEAASDAGADMQGFTRNVLAEYRNLLVARIDPELLSRDLSSVDAQATTEAAKATPQAMIVRGLRLFADSLAAGRVSGNPRLELDTAVLRLVVQGEDPTLDALATRVTLLEQGETGSGREAKPRPVAQVQAAESSVEAAPTAPAAPRTEPTLQRVQSLWPNICTRAASEKTTLRVPLARAVVDTVASDAVVVRMTDEINAGILRDQAAIMERAMTEVMGMPLRLQVIVRLDAGGRASVRKSAQQAYVAPSGPQGGDGEIDLLAYAMQKFTQTD